MIQRIWYVVVFCVLTSEWDSTWERHWSTPWHYISDMLFAPVPGVRVPWFDVILIVLFLLGGRRAGPRAKPIETTAWVSISTMLVWALYGAIRGGSVLDMRLQLHPFIAMLLSGLTQSRLMRTREHFYTLGKTVVYAALFRFAMMFTFYITVMRSLTVRVDTVTDHGDTILFVTTIVIVIANAVHARSRKATRLAIFVTVLMLWCIQINNRRLAYVSLVASVIVIVSLLWTKEFRRRLLRFLRVAVPVLCVYLAAGWSHPTGVFKPIASLQSANNAEDPSTQSRIFENGGLVFTLQTNPLFGTGFGHKYTQISQKYSVDERIFPQFRYVPHNSVLGLLAFTGALGFIGIWMIFPVTVYFAARSYAHAKYPVEKSVSMIALCEVLIHTNQMWGDIGIAAPQGLVLMAGAIAAAARMAVSTNAWPIAKRGA